MLRKDIDFNKLYELISAVPDYMDIESVSFTDGYKIHFSVNYSVISQFHYQRSLDELKRTLDLLSEGSERS